MFLLLMFAAFPVWSQTDTEEIQLNTFFNEDEENDLSIIAEQLSYYLEHPILIRKNNLKELEQLYLLNALQIETLREHIILFGELISIYELQSVDYFDTESIFRILPYVKVETDTRIRFDHRKISGNILYRVSERSNNPDKKKYLGSMSKHYLRLGFEQNGFGGIALCGEKDPGEEFFKGSNAQGFDHLSGNIHLYNRTLFSTLILGDFQVGFGQGLLINQGRTAIASIDMLGIKRSGKIFHPYASAMEINFNRGIALSIPLKRFSIHTFYSSTPVDSGSGTGLHRNSLELSKKYGQRKKLSGTSIRYNHNRIQIGLQHINEYSILAPQPSLSMDYTFSHLNLLWFGELALYHTAWAWIQGLICVPANGLTLNILYRNYAGNYNAPYASAFGENSTNRNEQGIFWGANYKANKRVSLSQSVDLFQFRLNQYRIDKASYGYSTISNCDISLKKQQALSIRIRYKEKYRNENTEEQQLKQVNETRRLAYRIVYTYKLSSSILLKSMYEQAYFRTPLKKDRGNFCMLELGYKPMSKALSFSSGYRIFNVEDYDARLYAYEADLPGAYSMPVINDQGNRFYINVRYKISKSIQLALKYAYNQSGPDKHYEYKTQLYYKI